MTSQRAFKKTSRDHHGRLSLAVMLTIAASLPVAGWLTSCQKPGQDLADQSTPPDKATTSALLTAANRFTTAGLTTTSSQSTTQATSIVRGSQGDVADLTTRPKNLIFDAHHFQDIMQGTKQADFVILFTTGSSFTVPLNIEEAGTYDLSLYVCNTRPAPIQINVINPDDPGGATRLLAQFSFEKGDDTWSMQTRTVQLSPQVLRLRIAFANDHYGPDGDRNAMVRRVIVQPHKGI